MFTLFYFIFFGSAIAQLYQALPAKKKYFVTSASTCKWRADPMRCISPPGECTLLLRFYFDLSVYLRWFIFSVWCLREQALVAKKKKRFWTVSGVGVLCVLFFGNDNLCFYFFRFDCFIRVYVILFLQCRYPVAGSPSCQKKIKLRPCPKLWVPYRTSALCIFPACMLG